MRLAKPYIQNCLIPEILKFSIQTNIFSISTQCINRTNVYAYISSLPIHTYNSINKHIYSSLIKPFQRMKHITKIFFYFIIQLREIIFVVLSVIIIVNIYFDSNLLIFSFINYLQCFIFYYYYYHFFLIGVNENTIHFVYVYF